MIKVKYFDGAILLWLQEYIRNSLMTPVLTFLTTLGNHGMIWIAISLALLIPKKTRKIGIMSLCALAGSYLINNLILKNVFARTRPYEVVNGLLPLIPKPTDFSFPSGHTGSSFAAACILYCHLPKKYGVPFLILAIIIAFSRLYLGVHYPSDVFIGMLTGIGISWLVTKSQNRVKFIRNSEETM